LSVDSEAESVRVLEGRIQKLAYGIFGVRNAEVAWLDGQLGLRRFARITLPGHLPATAVARVDTPEDPRGRPAGVPPEPPLEPIRALLEGAGLPVPRRYGADEEIEFLEDVGTTTLTDAVAGATPAERRVLYEAACDLIPALQRVRDPGNVEAFRRRLDAPLIAYKAALFSEWSLAARGQAVRPSEIAVVRDAFARVASLCAEAPQRLAHRDFQSANLHVQGSARSGDVHLRIIDLQGAFLAPPEYDLVCLLRDSYVELSSSEIREQLARIRPSLPDACEADETRHRFDLLTLVRKGKDHARFLYAASERGDTRFLRYVPHTVRNLRAAAHACAERDPAFADLADLVDELPETACAR